MRPKDRSCSGNEYPYSQLIPTSAGFILRHVCSKPCANKVHDHMIRRVLNKPDTTRKINHIDEDDAHEE
jgi:hypothetical protein